LRTQEEEEDATRTKVRIGIGIARPVGKNRQVVKDHQKEG
jgi:hypothetical protein